LDIEVEVKDGIIRNKKCVNELINRNNLIYTAETGITWEGGICIEQCFPKTYASGPLLASKKKKNPHHDHRVNTVSGRQVPKIKTLYLILYT
jgi:hypothetical protein